MKVLLFVCFCFGLAYAQQSNIVQLAESLGATTLVNLVKAAGLDSVLSGNGQFTVFGPTNAAFDALPDSVKVALNKDKDLLKKVLLFHVADGRTYSSQLSNNMIVQTVEHGLSIRVNIYNMIVTLDGAKVTLPDQNATNGVIHVIDKVMYPLPTARIPTIVAGMPELSTLLYAVSAGQLVGALSGDGPLTVFAPNNPAFDKLPVGKFSDLLSNQTALVDLLKYHVVSGAYYSKGLASGPVTALNGEALNITVSTDSVMVNSAKVLTADVPTVNGVIHIIDNVLIPKK